LDPLEFFLIVLASAFLAGILGSLLGLGGGVVMVPVLTLFLGVPPLFAIGASIVSVIATSSGAASAYVKDGITNLRIGMFLEVATTAGAVIGAVLTIALARADLEGVVYVTFGVVLLLSVLPLLKKMGEELPVGVTPDAISTRLGLNGEYHDKALGVDVQYRATRSPLGLVIMWVAGLISGLLGIGSGALKVLALDVGMKLPMKVSSTTSNFMIGVTAAASAGVYLSRGWIDPDLAMPVMLGVLTGSILGARELMAAGTRVLRLVFSLVVATMAIEMIFNGLKGRL
jgi:uncharacterized protein